MSATLLAEMTLNGLREYYRRYCLSIRNNCDDTVKMRFISPSDCNFCEKKQETCCCSLQVNNMPFPASGISLERFFAYFEGLDCAMDLFKQVTSSTVTDFLLGYASAFGSGSRQNMHSALQVFLRFAYVEGFVPQDLSALVPAVRRWKLAHVPRALPDECICALEGSIDCSTAAGKAPPPASTREEPPTWKQPKLMAFLIGLSRNVMLPKKDLKDKAELQSASLTT